MLKTATIALNSKNDARGEKQLRYLLEIFSHFLVCYHGAQTIRVLERDFLPARCFMHNHEASFNVLHP